MHENNFETFNLYSLEETSIFGVQLAEWTKKTLIPNLSICCIKTLFFEKHDGKRLFPTNKYQKTPIFTEAVNCCLCIKIRVDAIEAFPCYSHQTKKLRRWILFFSDAKNFAFFFWKFLSLFLIGPNWNLRCHRFHHGIG